MIISMKVRNELRASCHRRRFQKRRRRPTKLAYEPSSLPPCMSLACERWSGTEEAQKLVCQSTVMCPISLVRMRNTDSKKLSLRMIQGFKRAIFATESLVDVLLRGGAGDMVST